MPLRITNATTDVAVLNRWAEDIETRLNATTKQAGHALVTLQNTPPVVIPPSVGDGLTHGDLVWEHDSAYVELRDDFVPLYSASFGPTPNSSAIGELGWSLQGAISNAEQAGGNPPYIGQLAWENNATVNNAGLLLLNAGVVAAQPLTTFQRNVYALLENPGWKMTWVWKHDGTVQSTGDFQITKKAFYIGLSGAPVFAVTGGAGGATAVRPRPDIFIGLRYDTSATPGALTLSSVANAAGGSTVYTGTITGGDNGAYIGLTFVVAGFLTGANNGTFICTQSSATTLTLSNNAGVAETHAATATASGLNDAFYTFEAVINPQYQTAGVRHNAQGQTKITNVVPTMGTWHRLDITCSATGIIVMTLDGSSTNQFIVTIPTTSVTTTGGQVSCNTHEGRISSVVGTSGANSVPPFSAGSIITVSGLAGGNAALNGTWTLFYGDGLTIRFDAPAVSNIANNSAAATVVGYPVLTPICTFGNDDTASPTGQVLRTFIDFFSLVWNPNLGVVRAPDKTKARYW